MTSYRLVAANWSVSVFGALPHPHPPDPSNSLPPPTGPLSKLKPSQTCVALSDGSECVIRREIAGDNSCLFNAVGYGMHKVRSRSAHLRGVVAKTVSADREQYTEVVLEKSNEEVGDAVCTAQQYLFWSVVMQAGCHRGHRFLVQRVWLFGWDLP